ncbi:copper homeostasis protein cutC homolog [Lingula anatina]|uniref:Copper homeostasis protein cutC homolog n=1 Tax=Lingula anatina TaxID=7574 RepID=A0A1S3J9Q2_LINAN|nr:copper homeostasis protein cutC homolog [Lingula anatina]|eukprot:XP_013407125.2 copper homeostasis protein cutC homolog [Lingula anatina]
MADLAGQLPITFHRAIDMCCDWRQALEDIISLGCHRVLTSGQDSSALEGLPTIKQMIQQSRGRITVMPAGGINERNVKRILEGCGAKEFHASARSLCQSAMLYKNSSVAMGASLSPDEFSHKVTDDKKVMNLVTIATQVSSS